MSVEKVFPHQLTIQGIGIVWFEIQTVRSSSQSESSDPFAMTTRKPAARMANETVREWIGHRVTLSPRLDSKKILAELCIPPFSSFSALPYSIHRTDTVVGQPISKILGEAENADSNLHIATVADLLFLLPQSVHMLTDDAEFIAPMSRLNDSVRPCVDLCRFRRRRDRQGRLTPVWHVKPLIWDNADLYRGPFPVVYLSYRQPPIPRLAVHLPELPDIGGQA